MWWKNDYFPDMSNDVNFKKLEKKMKVIFFLVVFKNFTEVVADPESPGEEQEDMNSMILPYLLLTKDRDTVS